MKPVFAYVRVSDKKQEDGASLDEQKTRISNYAQKSNLKVTRWFIEQGSASQRHRPLYDEMIQKLKQQQAEGVIIHKVDRSARNRHDWSDLMDLMEYRGISIDFANSGIDLTTRGGRLQAEIEQVIAADYSRNLRDEVKKGLDGRLRNGIYPFAAPLGYLNTGKGNTKAIDPDKAPLVRALFERYATGDETLETLRMFANDSQLTNTKNKPLCINSLSLILHNPFYMGVIKIKMTGETYQGQHKPIISSELFDTVQEQFKEHKQPQLVKHNPILKSLVRCKDCGYGMPAEKQKGRYYYRCHQKACPTKGLREDRILNALKIHLEKIKIDAETKLTIEHLVTEKSTSLGKDQLALKQALKMKEGKLDADLERLTDLLIDGAIDKSTYLVRKERLSKDLRQIREQYELVAENREQLIAKVQEILELCFSTNLSDFEEHRDEKRIIIKKLTSNFFVSGKNALIELKEPFNKLSNKEPILSCVHQRRYSRTFETFEVERKFKIDPSCDSCVQAIQFAENILASVH